MALAAADIAFAKDLFSPLPDLTSRRMFGGMAFYSAGTVFALLRSDNQILIKARDPSFERLLAGMGSEKWTYTRKNGVESAMPYWTLPDAALDDPQMAVDLAERALTALESGL